MQFQDNTDKVKREMHDVLLGALTKGSLLVVGQVKTLSRRDTGALSDSFSHEVIDEGEDMHSKIGSPLDYAVHNEFGTGEFAENGSGRKGGWYYRGQDGKLHFTRGMKPNPALRTSFRKNKKRVQDIMSEDLGASFKGK